MLSADFFDFPAFLIWSNFLWKKKNLKDDLKERKKKNSLSPLANYGRHVGYEAKYPRLHFNFGPEVAKGGIPAGARSSCYSTHVYVEGAREQARVGRHGMALSTRVQLPKVRLVSWHED